MKVIYVLLLLAATMPGLAQVAPSYPSPVQQPGTMLLTVFLRHDETKTLDQIQAHTRATGFDRNFPPKGVEVVSWYVMMGVGQVVTLRLPPEKLREVNLVIEHGAWGAFRSDFYPTYDYKPVWEQEQKQQAGK